MNNVGKTKMSGKLNMSVIRKSSKQKRNLISRTIGWLKKWR